jgi:hypothetical protein
LKDPSIVVDHFHSKNSEIHPAIPHLANRIQNSRRNERLELESSMGMCPGSRSHAAETFNDMLESIRMVSPARAVAISAQRALLMKHTMAINGSVPAP